MVRALISAALDAAINSTGTFSFKLPRDPLGSREATPPLSHHINDRCDIEVSGGDFVLRLDDGRRNSQVRLKTAPPSSSAACHFIAASAWQKTKIQCFARRAMCRADAVQDSARKGAAEEKSTPETLTTACHAASWLARS